MLPKKLIPLAALLLSTSWCQAQDMQLGRSLAATCANCHGTNGVAKGEMAPLAGMPAAQLTSTLAAFKAGQRPATIMHQIAKGYTDEQIQLIAAFFAAQKK
jgi:cytochrome c553